MFNERDECVRHSFGPGYLTRAQGTGDSRTQLQRGWAMGQNKHVGKGPTRPVDTQGWAATVPPTWTKVRWDANKGEYSMQ